MTWPTTSPHRQGIRLRRMFKKMASPQPIQRPVSWQVAPNLLKSCQYAGLGILYACQTQRNFRIHLVMTVLALGLSLGLGCSAVEIVLIGLTCGLVLSLELLNTALEAVVDLTVGQEFHLLAKIAKDCAAGAVLVAALTSLGVAALLLLPPLLNLLGGMLGGGF
ncbi:MAG: diacylglycerol kinase family protein [Synechococcaceae cyanobacterium SM2_3_2]|nr:diacylglycerol kinase family protein [Synechococcaceae cyanobacterium SM2_3_2]